MADTKEVDTAFVRLPKEAFEDIAELIRNRQFILDVAQKSVSEKPAASIAGLSVRLAKRTGIDTAVAVQIATALWSLKGLQQHLEVDSRRLVELIGKSLELQAAKKWQEDYLQGWKEASSSITVALEAITDDHPLITSAKAGTLAYTQQNLFTNARLITDIRPVFDKAGENVLETVVLHTLVLNFVDGSQDKTMMTFSLDREDVAILRRECERAERKSQVIVDTLKNLNPVLLPEKAEP